MEPVRSKTEVKNNKTAIGYLEWEFNHISSLFRNVANIHTVKSELEYIAILIRTYMTQNEESKKLLSAINEDIKWINQNKKIDSLTEVLRIYNQHNRSAIKILDVQNV